MRNLRLALILLSALALTACSDSKAKKKPPSPPIPITATTAAERDVAVQLQVVGRAEAFENVVIKSRVDGQVASVHFTEGQRVKQGDILIRLDPTDFAARLQQAEATAARDEALIAKTRADTARYSALKERNFVSEEKVNDIRTNEAAATANLRASKAAGEVARLQLSYTTIRAPISGVVGARLVFPGSSVKVNDTILAVVNRPRPLLVSFSLPEKHLPRLRSALKNGTMQVDVTVPGDTTQSFQGAVRFVDNAVDPATGTILMKAELPNEDDKLTPGQFLNVTLTLNTLKAAVSIPNEAVQQGAEGTYVFVVKSDGTADNRAIEVAASNDGYSAISKGLQAGETVVTDGHMRLTPGAKVKIKETDGKPQDKNSTAQEKTTPEAANTAPPAAGKNQ